MTLTDHLVDAVVVFLTLGFMEAIVKPAATSFAKRMAAPILASDRVQALLDVLDSALPELIEEQTGELPTFEDLKIAFSTWDPDVAILKARRSVSTVAPPTLRPGVPVLGGERLRS